MPWASSRKASPAEISRRAALLKRRGPSVGKRSVRSNLLASFAFCPLRLAKIALVLVRLDQLACVIINANNASCVLGENLHEN